MKKLIHFYCFHLINLIICLSSRSTTQRISKTRETENRKFRNSGKIVRGAFQATFTNQKEETSHDRRHAKYRVRCKFIVTGKYMVKSQCGMMCCYSTASLFA